MNVDFRRNNLDRAHSLYLRQHAKNPIWWQEWGKEVSQEAAKKDMLIFVSVGYSSCHWCHVMAEGAFSDRETADFMNEHFVCVKVDREQRPDIDHYLMKYLTSTTGGGGWPLNAFLTPSLDPVFAFTYAPARSTGQGPGLIAIARQIRDFYDANRTAIRKFRLQEDLTADFEEQQLIDELASFYDTEYGGWGTMQKFPPHATLLFLLYHQCVDEEDRVREMCARTLTAMRRGGLNDHLQGGIFRYCVDREWSIPHFEKMLYDQAMGLWCYALAYKVLSRPEDKGMALGIIRCLDESFRKGDCYVSAHDADTDHVEGGTYVWSYAELQESLNPKEFSKLREVYVIEPEGNFEGRIHLTRRNDIPLPDIEAKLLASRKIRPQAQVDKSVYCGMNALVAIAFVHAARYLAEPGLFAVARDLMKNLLEKFWDGTRLAHSIRGASLQEDSFLFDAAAVCGALCLLFEEDPSWNDILAEIAAYLDTFHEQGVWIESKPGDFHRVAAGHMDQPVPSSAALAQWARSLLAVQQGDPVQPLGYRRPFQSDFHNIAAMITRGLFHIIRSPDPVDARHVPANTIWVRASVRSDCYKGACRDLSDLV